MIQNEFYLFHRKCDCSKPKQCNYGAICEKDSDCGINDPAVPKCINYRYALNLASELWLGI